MTNRKHSLKRHILKNEERFPCQIFGLICTKSITQFVWNLSEELDIPLCRKADIEQTVNDITDYWPYFKFFDEDTETTYSVVRNKGTQLQLAPELRTIDVFLVETNPSLIFQLTLNKLSKTRFVDFCFEVKGSMISQETEYLLQLE